MTNQDIIIGIDAGTSVIKAVAFDLEGRQISSSKRRNVYKTLANGGVEQNMNRTWDDTVAVLCELRESVPDCARRCIALAVTGQGDGTWLVDKDGEPAHDGWLWLDARAAEISNQFSESAEAEFIYKQTATGINVCQMRTQLNWIKSQQPDLIQQSSKALHCKDWLYYKLTDEFATDITEGGFTFGNFRTRDYCEEVIKALGLSEFRNLLPPIIDGTITSHRLSSNSAVATGFPEGLPVCLGLVDVMCCALGAGLYDPETRPGLTIFGSTGVHLRFVDDADSVILNKERSGYTMPFPGKAFAQMQTNMAATLNIDWVLSLAVQVLGTQGISKQTSDLLSSIDEILLTTPPGKACFHPYILASGERGPFTNPNARASWTGLDQSVSWSDLVRSVCDGLVMAAKDCYQILGEIPGEIRLTGGAANSKSMQTMLASAINAPVRVISQSEAGAAGAALIAAVNQGVFKNVDEAVKVWVNPLLQPAEMPDSSLVETYDSLFSSYLASRLSLSNVWDVQAEARRELSR